MKKCCCLIMSLVCCTAIFAQKTGTAVIPQKVLLSFNHLRPEVKKPVWKADGSHHFAAAFESYSGSENITFDSLGVVVRKQSDLLSQEALPAYLQDSLRRYKSMEFVRAVRTETSDGCVTFDIDVAQNRTIQVKRFTQGCQPPKRKAVNTTRTRKARS